MNACLDLVAIDLSQAIRLVMRQMAGVGAVVPLCTQAETSVLILLDLASTEQPRQSGLENSGLAQVFGLKDKSGLVVASQPVPQNVRELINQLTDENLVLACQARNAGGLLAAAWKMAVGGKVGVSLNLDMLTIDPASADWGDYKIRPEQVAVQRHEAVLAALFSEGAGVLLQVPARQRNTILGRLRQAGLAVCSHVVGGMNVSDELQIYSDGRCIFQSPWAALLTDVSEDDAPFL